MAQAHGQDRLLRDRSAAAELFLSRSAERLVVEVAHVLGERGIPVMPLKGALLQKLVYFDHARGVRRLSDVDVLVPAPRFAEAHETLRAAGFTRERWEGGRWQVAMSRPGSLLALDLHQRLSRTARAKLTSEEMFRGAQPNRDLFGVEVFVPRPESLFAHLVLHAALHCVNNDALHHPEDFLMVPERLHLDPRATASDLLRYGLGSHALFLFALLPRPLSAFLQELAGLLKRHPSQRAKVAFVRAVAERCAPGSLVRRSAALLLSDQWGRALWQAGRLRLSSR
jgi:hypothetical protein